MGKGTRVLIAILAGALTAILLAMVIFLIGTIFLMAQANVLASQMVINAATITPTANGTVHAELLGRANTGVNLFGTLIFFAALSLAGLITALVTYRLLGRAPVRE